VPAVTYRADVRLAELTTLRVGGPARRLVEVADVGDLPGLLAAADAAGDPVLVLGGGSNVVVGDAGFAGTVLRAAWRGIDVQGAGEGLVRLRLAAGEPWDDVVARAVAEGWSGVEALSGIPGLVGATPIQNVGAYGQEVADVLASVDVLDRQRDGQVTLAADACGFGYRTSRFKQEPDRFVVLSVELTLRRTSSSAPIRYADLARALGVAEGARAPMGDVRQAVLELRRSKGMVLDPQDHDTWSAGSFFTNPVLGVDDANRLPAEAPRWPQGDGRVKTSAAWLIEQSGMGRGWGGDLTGGRATLSGKHPLAVTNRGSATASDVVTLAHAVQAGVHARFGIALTPEPTLLPPLHPPLP
jgi:UDP-N-acetylmuramate dehydrogenase